MSVKKGMALLSLFLVGGLFSFDLIGKKKAYFDLFSLLLFQTTQFSFSSADFHFSAN